MSNGSSKTSAFKKKLYRYRPNHENSETQTHRTRTRLKSEPSDPASLERGVRQLLADKISGNMLGLWLLIPEHLRLGTWDLLCNWSGQGTENVEPRLALQLVHEAALCVTGVRQSRNLAQKGFELANGLPFVATDWAMHQLLAPHTVEESQQLQVTLGKLRLASGHYKGTLLAIDPHRLRSYSKRQMRRRQKDPQAQANKVAQTFFALDADTGQPVCFVSHCSATSVSQATPRLLRLAAEILNPRPGGSLVLADSEHFTAELLDHISSETNFDMLVPMPMRQYIRKQIENIPPNQFTPR